MRKTYLVLIVAMLLTGLFFTGCAEPETVENGTANDDKVAAPDESDVTEEADVPEENNELDLSYIFNTNSVPMIVGAYKELRYSILENGREVSTIHYLYQGTESIKGVETDKVTVDYGYEGIFTFWLDSAGNLQKVESDGDEIPVEVVEASMQHLLTAILLPFNTVYEWNVAGGLQGEVPGITSREIDIRTETFGADTVKVYVFEVIVGPPVLGGGESGKMHWEIATFPDHNKQHVVGWEVIEGRGVYFETSFKIDSLVFR